MDRRWFGGCSRKLINQLMIQSPNPLAEDKQEFFSGFERLYLEDLEEIAMPDFFKYMDNLTSLTICNSEFGGLLRSSDFPENLRSLSINTCNISHFLFDGKGLSDLLSLNLSGNLLTSIPRGLENLSILVEVVLKDNNITGEVDLSCFKGRDVLVDLDGNQVTSLVESDPKSKQTSGMKIDGGLSVNFHDDKEEEQQIQH